MDEATDQVDRLTELRHLHRKVQTSLELAIVARAPTALIDRLGRASGLLDAITQLPLEGGPARAMLTDLVAEALAAVDTWRSWEQARAPAA